MSGAENNQPLNSPKNTAAKVVKTYHQPKSASKFLHLLPIKNDIFICSTCNWIEKLEKKRKNIKKYIFFQKYFVGLKKRRTFARFFKQTANSSIG